MCIYLGWGFFVLRNKPLSWPGLFSLSIHQLCLCLRLCGCVGSWGPSPFPLPLSLALSPGHPPSVCWRGPRGRFGPWPSGPCVCVYERERVCVPFAPPLPAVMYYRWDLRLSVSASAARRRRKQDARGSTVISQCALFHTIPGQSLYSLHAGPPLDIYMCQQSHSYWPT